MATPHVARDGAVGAETEAGGQLTSGAHRLGARGCYADRPEVTAFEAVGAGMAVPTTVMRLDQVAAAPGGGSIARQPGTPGAFALVVGGRYDV